MDPIEDVCHIKSSDHLRAVYINKNKNPILENDLFIDERGAFQSSFPVETTA